MSLVKILVGCLFLLQFGVATAGENVNEAPSKKNAEIKFERIGGTFNVSQIKRLNDGGFQVVFSAKETQGPFRKLTLETQHVHMGIREGVELRLSADVISVRGGEAEIAQAVLFMPSHAGDNPIWMLSRRNHVPSSPPVKLLEMHAPATDFMIL